MRLWLAAAVFLGVAELAGAQTFTLRGPTGVETIDPGASSATVVVFTSTRCPISDGYNSRLKELFASYSAKGVRFLVVNANGNEPLAEVLAYRTSHTLPYPVYKDEDHTLADRLGARVTPEAYLLKRDGTVAYQGAIDDSPNQARVKQHSLQEAIDAVLAGQPVPRAETKAFGCTIKRTGSSTAR